MQAPIETSNSDAIHAVLHAENDRCGLGPIESCISAPKVAVLHSKPLGPIETSYPGANHAVLHAENDRCGLGPIESCNSAPKVAILHAKTTGTHRDKLFWC